MSNLNNNNFHNLRLRFNYDEYWDLFLDKDNYSHYVHDIYPYDICLSSYIDISENECVDGRWLYSKCDNVWSDAYSTDYTLYNIGYCGVDNGLIRFRRDRVSNKEFFDIYTNSTYDITSTDKRLKLHQVSGATNLYEYPTEIIDGVLKLNGGFYQGFFETECDKYKVLPSTVDDDWHFEFVLKKEEFEKESEKTLNDKYPNNKGIFFYIGTRAENKWKYLYEKDDECDILSEDDYIEDAHIDKKGYIINNFFGDIIEFNGYEINIDDYLNYKFYSPKEYEFDVDKFSYDDYIEDEYAYQPKLIDEDKLPYVEINCCGNDLDILNKPKRKYYFNNCSCNVKYNKKKNNNIEEDNDLILGCMSFGYDYIDDFEGLDDGTDYIEQELDISDFNYETDNGLPLKISNQYYFETDNKFLIFDRSCKGYNVDNWIEGDKVLFHGTTNKFKGNLFLLMNRTCSGYSVDNIDSLRDSQEQEYNVNSDLYSNALAFQITDKGEIGYRYLVTDCENDEEGYLTLMKGYSYENVISENEWHVINVRIKPFVKTMVLYFYVDGKLKYITSELPLLNLRKLNEIYEKQEGVPYNISLGGGSQGLAETILPNYMLNPSKVYPIEKYFGGTFIGWLKSFKFYTCGVEYKDIFGNFEYEMRRLK